MKIYEVSLWPNNQPPILIGYFKGNNKNSVLREVCPKYSLDMEDDNVRIEEDGLDTPIKIWNKS